MSADARSSTSNTAPVILHVMQSFKIAGAESHLLALLPALRERGWDVRFWGFSTSPTSEFSDALAAKGIPVSVTCVDRLRSLKAARALRRVITNLRPAIVHSHLYYGDIQAQLALIGSRSRSVRTLHNGPQNIPPGLRRKAFAWAGSRADRTIACSRYLSDAAQEHHFAPTDRIRVIHHGLDPDAWSPPAAARSRARADLGLADGDVVVTCTSRLSALKGQETLIRAFAKAGRADPALRLVLAGTGPEEQRFRELAQQLLDPKTFRFAGFVDDVRPLLWASDIFVLPTYAEFGEGFPMATLEATAAHLPVIASDQPPVLELVEHGRTGIIVPPRDEGALERALLVLSLDHDLRSRFAAEGARRIREHFTQDQMVRATVGVYEEIVPSLRAT